MRYAIHCRPGGWLKDSSTGNVITFDTLAAAVAEAQRSTRADPSAVTYSPVAAPNEPDRH